jgi:uncharacterized protein (DUF58 family)
MQQQHGNQNRKVMFSVLRFLMGTVIILSGVFKFRENRLIQGLLIVAGVVYLSWSFGHMIPDRWKPSRSRLFRRVYRERLRMPTEVLVYIVIMITLACGSMLGHSNTLLLVFSLMAGPFILNGWVVYAMLQRVEVERELPQSAGAGETFSVHITLRNKRRFLSSRLMRVADTISNKREVLKGRVLFFRVPVQEARTASYRVRLMQRGAYELGPTLVSSRFPFGLGERGRYFETPGEILIHPQIGELSPAWWRRVLGEDRQAHNLRARRGVFDDEFKQIREYRPGDPIRSIHWRTSARKDDLMVREFQETREHDAVLMVELWQSPNADDAELRTELAASFAATVCHQFASTMHNSNVAFFLSGSENVSIVGKASPDTWNQILNALARCSASPKADLEWLEQQLSDTRGSDQSPIFVTTRGADEKPDNLGSRGHVVHATPSDLESIFRVGDDGPEDLLVETPVNADANADAEVSA